MKRIAFALLVLLAGSESFTGVRPYTNECHPDRYYTEPQDTTDALTAAQAWCKAEREKNNGK
jgi:hypothetical protein